MTAPTVYRTPANGQGVAPFVFVSLHAEREVLDMPVRLAMQAWADNKVDVSSTWHIHATANHLLSEAGRPFCSPTFAIVGEHRWAALVREAATELHVYLGHNAGNRGELAKPKVVAESATAFVNRVRATKVWNGSSNRTLSVRAELFIAGIESGRMYRPAKGYWRTFGERDNLKEGAPLFLAAVGALLAGSEVSKITLSRWELTLFFVVAAYAIFTLLRWLPARSGAVWASDDWPVAG